MVGRLTFSILADGAALLAPGTGAWTVACVVSRAATTTSVSGVW